MVHGSWSGPPMRMRDRVFPGVDVGAGRVIGGGSFGRMPVAISSRILARGSGSVMLGFSVNAFDEVRFECRECLTHQLTATSQVIERDVLAVGSWNTHT